MSDPLKFQRALFAEMEPPTIVGEFDGTIKHRRRVVYAHELTDADRKKFRGKNCGVCLAMKPPDFDDGEFEKWSNQFSKDV